MRERQEKKGYQNCHPKSMCTYSKWANKQKNVCTHTFLKNILIALLFVSFSYPLFLSILPLKYQSQRTSPLFSNCTHDIIQVEQNNTAYCKKDTQEYYYVDSIKIINLIFERCKLCKNAVISFWIKLSFINWAKPNFSFWLMVYFTIE